MNRKMKKLQFSVNQCSSVLLSITVYKTLVGQVMCTLGLSFSIAPFLPKTLMLTNSRYTSCLQQRTDARLKVLLEVGVDIHVHVHVHSICV